MEASVPVTTSAAPLSSFTEAKEEFKKRLERNGLGGRIDGMAFSAQISQ